MYTLDTNVIIYYLKGDENAVGIMDGMLAKQSTMYVSAISETELFRFPQLSEEEVAQIDAMLRSVSVLPVDSKIARMAGAIQRLYGLQTADGIIAATAVSTGTTLVTRNIRDFKPRAVVNSEPFAQPNPNENITSQFKVVGIGTAFVRLCIFADGPRQ